MTNIGHSWYLPSRMRNVYCVDQQSYWVNDKMSQVRRNTTPGWMTEVILDKKAVESAPKAQSYQELPSVKLPLGRCDRGNAEWYSRFFICVFFWSLWWTVKILPYLYAVFSCQRFIGMQGTPCEYQIDFQFRIKVLKLSSDGDLIWSKFWASVETILLI